MAILYYAEHVHIARMQAWIPAPYFYIVQEFESKFLPVSESGIVIKPLHLTFIYCKGYGDKGT